MPDWRRASASSAAAILLAPRARGPRHRVARAPRRRNRDAVGAEMFKEGVIFTGAGHEAINPTLIFTPPLIIEKTHIDEFAAALEPSLARAWASVGLE